MEFEGRPTEFYANDISCIPKNLPHTTYSAKGCSSLWSYIFIDIDNLFWDNPSLRPLLSRLSMSVHYDKFPILNSYESGVVHFFDQRYASVHLLEVE